MPGVPVQGKPARPDPASVAAVGRTAMISTSHPAATDAGVAALRQGGSAVDAYVAAAAVQTVVEPTMTGLGGGFSVAVYEPSVGRSRLVGGMGGLPAAEDGKLDEAARWSGRTAVPPAWVSGAHLAWQQWGKLPWADLFAGALTAARDGFVVDQQLWGWMFEYRTVPGRSAAGRDVWFPDGVMVGVGDVLRQPALARTIEQLAEQGPKFIYEGDFAHHYVETARAAGGRISLDDMAACQEGGLDVTLPVIPVEGVYELHTHGILYALAMNLAAVGGLRRRGRPTEDVETLYLLMRIVEECWHFGLTFGDSMSAYGSDEDGQVTAHIEQMMDAMVQAVSVERAEKLWPQVESGPPRPFDGMNLNTNAIVCVDESGTVAHGTHSTSSTPFGAGLIVDWVIVPRPMYYFTDPKPPVAEGRATSLLALRDGKPVLAAGSPSISAFQNVLQNTLNVLEGGMTPGESVRQPLFGSPVFPSQRPMVEATFGDALIDEVERRGLSIKRVSPWEPEMGSCHAVHIAEDGTLSGAADPRRLGRVSGY